MAKNVKRNVADSFFAGVTEEFENINNKHKQYTENINTNTTFNIGVQKKETKSKRVNLVLQPSLYEKAQAVAKANGISFNEMVTQMLQQVTKTPEEYADGSMRPDGQLTGQLSVDDM